MLAGWMGVFAMHAAIAIRKIKKHKKDKKKSKLTPADIKKNLVSSIGVMVAAITFFVFAFSNSAEKTATATVISSTRSFSMSAVFSKTTFPTLLIT